MTDLRLHALNKADVRPDGGYVLYWMVANRRLGWNFALDRAVERARALDRPLVILEALRIGYRWASDRHHRFVLDGMAEHRTVLADSGVTYHPYVEPEEGAGKGLLAALADDACVVVTDVYPAFFLPRMLDAAADALDVRLEAVDSCGLLPLKAAGKTFSAAYHFRRYLQKTLPEYLVEMPDPNPLADRDFPAADPVPDSVAERWPAASDALLDPAGDGLAALAIDHGVAPVEARGGHAAGRARLDAFLDHRLDRYADQRNDPDADAQSGLSPWLHWGHLSAHEVFHAVADKEGWSPARLSDTADGKREGWWGMGTDAEAFLDELITWRELGHVYCWLRPDYADYDTLPDWARETLDEHAGDERPWVYSLEEFEAAGTHDPLWNAAQRQLREDGIIHNYLRMLWGKKILEWSEHPRTALDIMVELNNKYAIDGRDPNSWSGIFWTLGRFDRGWPEREVFGKVRSMTSKSTRRKVALDDYLARWAGCDADDS
ncbi:MAG: hypothetical protein RJQ04_01595 [Longimicrobiales bacterium]